MSSRPAVLEAARFVSGGELFIVHVHQPRRPAGAEFGAEAEATVDPIPELRHALQVLADEVRKRVAEVHASVEIGPASETIVKFVLDHGCDLIVVGRSPRSKLGRMILGSVSESVLATAPCPVLVLPMIAGRELVEQEDERAEIAQYT